MCTSPARDEMTRHPFQSDVGALSSLYSLDPEPVQAIFDAITDRLHVKLISFVAIVDLYSRYVKGERGVTGFGPNLLYSAHERDKKSLVRYQSHEMELVDDAMVEIARSDRNKRMLNSALAPFGVQFVENCCCGSAIVEAQQVDAYLDSDWYTESNHWRSLANVYGWVFDDKKGVTLDSIPRTSEIRDEYVFAYRRIWNYTQMLGRMKHDIEGYLIIQGVPAVHVAPIMAERRMVG